MILYQFSSQAHLKASCSGPQTNIRKQYLFGCSGLHTIQTQMHRPILLFPLNLSRQQQRIEAGIYERHRHDGISRCNILDLVF